MEVEKGKYMFGSVKVGEKGQIVIPVDAREKFDISPGDTLLVLGDEGKGITLVKANKMRDFVLDILEGVEVFGIGERAKEKGRGHGDRRGEDE